MNKEQLIRRGYVPLRKNRFAIRFNFDKNIEPFMFKSFFYTEDTLSLTILDSSFFFSPAYFDVNGPNIENESITVELVDKVGEVVAEILFEGVRFERYVVNEFDYSKDEPMETVALFTFDSVKHKTLHNAPTTA